MKIIPNSRRHRYMAGVGIFLVTIALIVGMISWPPAPSYNLTIASTAGGSVTTPGEGTFTYYEGTVVIVIAKAEEGYHFVNWSGNVGTIANVGAATTTITMGGNYSITANFTQYTIQVDAGAAHTVGVKNDGTVVAVGWNEYGQCDVGNWTDIVQVDAGAAHTVGVKNDGTVVAVGYNNDGQCNVSGWTSIIQVAAGDFHTVGVKSDGTVVTVGGNSSGQCNVDGWTDIIQVDAGAAHTVGVKSDGTVVAVGNNGDGQCNVDGWTDIIQVTAGDLHTVGVKDNGTVVAVGRNDEGQCNVDGW